MTKPNVKLWSPWTPEGDLHSLPNSRAATSDQPDASVILPDGVVPAGMRFTPATEDGWHSGTTYTGNTVRQAANDNLPPVVAFTGLAGSGKSTATRYLVDELGYTLVKFAGPLKDMMYALGFLTEDIEGDMKEEPHVALCGKSPRHAMQTLGTQWGRDCIGEDFWVNLWRARAEAVLAQGGRVVTDDCRFPNEAKAIRKLGGDIFRLIGRGGIAGDHASEKGCGDEDLVIANDNTPAALFGKVEEALRRYG